MTRNVCLLMLALALAVTASADSLDCRLVGNWPFGPSYADGLYPPCWTSLACS